MRPASAGDTYSNSMPKLFARAICRLMSCSRSGVFATFRLPHCFQPVARPVSASSDEYSSMPYWLIRVALRVARVWPTRPAACQVVPHVSLPCSSSTTSVTPSFAR